MNERYCLFGNITQITKERCTGCPHAISTKKRGYIGTTFATVEEAKSFAERNGVTDYGVYRTGANKTSDYVFATEEYANGD